MFYRNKLSTMKVFKEKKIIFIGKANIFYKDNH